MHWGARIRQLRQRLFGQRRTETAATVGGLELTVKSARFVFVRGETTMRFYHGFETRDPLTNCYLDDKLFFGPVIFIDTLNTVTVQLSTPIDRDFEVRIFA